jgi:hypothetical protein
MELEQRSRNPAERAELARHEFVGSILRWTNGASSAQNSETILINIGKSWVGTGRYHAAAGPSTSWASLIPNATPGAQADESVAHPLFSFSGFAYPRYRQVSALRNPAAAASSSEQNHRLACLRRR